MFMAIHDSGEYCADAFQFRAGWRKRPGGSRVNQPNPSNVASAALGGAANRVSTLMERQELRHASEAGAFGAYQLAPGCSSVYYSHVKMPTPYHAPALASWATTFLACALAMFAGLYRVTAEDKNVLAASDWSAPVDSQARVDHPIRGRLLILSGSEPAYGGPKTDNHTMLFVELQDAVGACCGSIKLWFDVMGLKLDLVDANGKPAPIDQVGGWGGRGAFGGCWVVLPYNSTQRLFVNPGTKTPLRICRGGEPWDRWCIPSTDTNTYYLSGMLTVSTPTNSTFSVVPQEKEGAPHNYADWTGTLTFPKMKISPADIAKRK